MLRVSLNQLRTLYIHLSKLREVPDTARFTDYFEACDLLQGRALSQSTKLPAADFKRIREYIKANKLNEQDKQVYSDIVSAVDEEDQDSCERLKTFFEKAIKPES